MKATSETQPSPRAVRSSDIVAEVVHDAQRLVGLEIALAKREVTDVVTANAIAAGLMAFGGLLVILAVLVAAPSLVVVLVPWHWQAAVAWIAAYALLGIGFVSFGRSRFALRLPTRTLESLKENREWALRLMKSTVR